MIVVIKRSGATLQHLEDTKRLHVEVHDGLGAEQTAEVLKQTNLGTIGDGHAFLRPAGLRSLAGPAATPEWDRAFTAMADYAVSKGWIDADGALQAHIEYAAEGPTE